MPPLHADKTEQKIYGTIAALALCAYTSFIVYDVNKEGLNQWIGGPPAIGIGKIDLDPAQTEIAGRKVLYYDKLSRCVTQETSYGWSANRYFDTDYSGNLDTRVSYTLVRGLGAVPSNRKTITQSPELFTYVNSKYQQMILQEKNRNQK